MPDVQLPPVSKTASKSKKASALNQVLKPARIRAKVVVATAPIPYVSTFAIGDEIAHPQFGAGTVTEIDGEKLTIDFANRGTKQIIDYYVQRRKTA
jgi:PcrA/UvrD helicase-like protein